MKSSLMLDRRSKSSRRRTTFRIQAENVTPESGWVSYADAGASNGAGRFQNNTAAGSLTYRFNLPAQSVVSVGGWRGTGGGVLGISVDGGAVTTIDCNAGAGYEIVWSTVLAAGDHTVNLIRSSGLGAYADYLDVEPFVFVTTSDFSYMPTTDGWSAPNGSGHWSISGSDILHQATNAVAQYFQRTDLSDDYMSVDFSLKVNSIAGLNVSDRMWGCWLTVGSGTGKGLLFHFFDGQIWVSNGSSGDLTALTSPGEVDLTAFHRYTISKSVANFKFFVDNVQKGGVIAARTNDNAIQFGQGSSGGGTLLTNADWDWLRVAQADFTPNASDLLPV